MSTAQLVLGKSAQTEQMKTWIPWVIGGLVAVAVLFVIANILKG